MDSQIDFEINHFVIVWKIITMKLGFEIRINSIIGFSIEFLVFTFYESTLYPVSDYPMG